MFGYVVLSKNNANKEELKEYRDNYCGLCHVLGEKYGKDGMKNLSYDILFLSLVLSDLYDETVIKGEEKCIIHPLKSHHFEYTNATYYAADMQLLLSYYSLLDNVKDEGRDKKEAESLKKYIRELELKYPRQSSRVKENLIRLSKREENNSKEVEELASLFGEILGEIFVWREDDFFAPELMRLGSALGRYIYLLDAWNDKKRDQRRKLFNPLPSEITLDAITALLSENAAIASDALESLPLDEHTRIVRNIIYSGIWTRFKRGR